MKRLLPIALLLPMTLFGCTGGGGNTVEAPANPQAAPKGEPTGTGGDGVDTPPAPPPISPKVK